MYFITIYFFLNVCSLRQSIFTYLGQANLTECSCSNACSELEYESRVSYSKFPDNSIIEILQHMFKNVHSPRYMK